MKIIVILAFCLCLNPTYFAQLQLDQIMKGPGFVGALPEAPEWSLDGMQIYYWKKFPDSLQKTYYSYDLAEQKTTILTKHEWQNRWAWVPDAGALNYMRIQDQALEIKDPKTLTIKTFPLFTNAIWNLQVQNKAQTVVFQQGKSLFVFDLQKGGAKKLVCYQTPPALKPS